MGSDLFLVVMSIFTAVLLVTLIVMLVLVQRAIAGLLNLLRSLHHEVMPLVGDLRNVSLDLAEASAELRDGAQKINRITGVLAGIGDDVDDARQSVRRTLENAREAVQPWLDRLRGLGSRLRLLGPRKETRYV
jgi:hypothetical protein